MGKIVKITSLKKFIEKINKQKETLVIVGGCFDVIHIGHINFLNQAKKSQEKLLILLESDEKVKKLKGTNRPIFNQIERAILLSNVIITDYILLLPDFERDDQYKKLLDIIKPAVIAVTKNDQILEKKKKQAKSIGATLRIVSYINNQSTSKIMKILSVD